MKNIIFLDIDGVLNCQVFYEKTMFTDKNPKTVLKNKVRKEEIGRLEFYLSQLDPERIGWLNKLCEDTDSGVVISSTWRKNKTIDELREILTLAGATFNIIGKTGDSACHIRGCEIREWQSEHAKEYFPSGKYNYVIIDDDSDMLLWQKDNFFQTDCYSGLTPNVCYRIKNFLNKE